MHDADDRPGGLAEYPSTSRSIVEGSGVGREAHIQEFIDRVRARSRQHLQMRCVVFSAKAYGMAFQIAGDVFEYCPGIRNEVGRGFAVEGATVRHFWKVYKLKRM